MVIFVLCLVTNPSAPNSLPYCWHGEVTNLSSLLSPTGLVKRTQEHKKDQPSTENKLAIVCYHLDDFDVKIAFRQYCLSFVRQKAI